MLSLNTRNRTLHEKKNNQTYLIYQAIENQHNNKKRISFLKKNKNMSTEA